MIGKSMFMAVSYLKYYRRQTAVLLLGVILSSALLTGMGGLLASGKRAALEHARSQYGDWHYSIKGDEKDRERLRKS